MASKAERINARIVRKVLTMRATVWGRTGGSGAFNNALRTDLPCRLDTVNIQPAATSTERTALASLRTFMWDTTYTLPEQGTQIEITNVPIYATQRWNVQAGTLVPHRAAPIKVDVQGNPGSLGSAQELATPIRAFTENAENDVRARLGDG
jgi:hypothetical protein